MLGWCNPPPGRFQARSYLRVGYPGPPLSAFSEVLHQPPPNLSQSPEIEDEVQLEVHPRFHYMNPRFHCKSYVVKSRIGIENIGSQILEKSAARHLRSGAILAGEMEFDLALLLSQNRSLTQRAATAIYALGFDGIFYQSRHGADLFNWALFEPFNLKDPIEAEIPFTDPDFQEALRRLDLNFDDMR